MRRREVRVAVVLDDAQPCCCARSSRRCALASASELPVGCSTETVTYSRGRCARSSCSIAPRSGLSRRAAPAARSGRAPAGARTRPASPVSSTNTTAAGAQQRAGHDVQGVGRAERGHDLPGVGLHAVVREGAPRARGAGGRRRPARRGSRQRAASRPVPAARRSAAASSPASSHLTGSVPRPGTGYCARRLEHAAHQRGRRAARRRAGTAGDDDAAAAAAGVRTASRTKKSRWRWATRSDPVRAGGRRRRRPCSAHRMPARTLAHRWQAARRLAAGSGGCVRRSAASWSVSETSALRVSWRAASMRVSIQATIQMAFCSG